MRSTKVTGRIRMEVVMSTLSDPLLSKRELEALKSAARRSHLARVSMVWVMRAVALAAGAGLTLMCFR